MRRLCLPLLPALLLSLSSCDNKPKETSDSDPAKAVEKATEKAVGDSIKQAEATTSVNGPPISQYGFVDNSATTPKTFGPAPDAKGDQLFPPNMYGIQRAAMDEKTAPQGFGLEGMTYSQARYTTANWQGAEVFAYKIDAAKSESLQKAAVAKIKEMKPAYDMHRENGGLWEVHYRGEKPTDQIIICGSKEWILFFRSKELANLGEFFDVFATLVFKKE